MVLRNCIKECRTKKEISQEELAKAVGVSRQTIHAIEKGSYNPSLELSFKLSLYFNKTIEELFQYTR
ncbi:helix-turn-helix transcriptional regulator [Listeria fleischmannii]|uniref:Helix-turn-helix transcriptional regulator n=1 Tax=Listeria fleischmannii TaxID=1069827 RepID=A0A841YCI0_9LIST|nr:helix-turn-helix transcriptional regulator [Listeria fleischmannii]MBC1398032.1 helix-turn-helix transcriptional regulator [Listeria fleischmannii]MBC1406121.1 helix-turn-helix transcriptional regulator [Listeria welshimeri]MBC1426093.1 helix-turn-helix transcriptional regulator [Listeria fleischmannii]